MINHNGYQRPNYSILWHTPTHKFLCFSNDSLDILVTKVERWYQTRPRNKQQPKIVCNTTGRVIYE